MPFYEYRCESCDHRFEELVPSVHSPPPACPACQAERSAKLPSAFAVGRGAPAARPASPGCGGCPAAAGGAPGGACPMAQ